jgi:tRNA-dihydrouridine synthase C
MRLGIDDTCLAVDCAQAIEAGGADELIVHGRTKADGYRPPARWAHIDRVRAAVGIPIIANGELWTVDDYRRCREASGCADVMLGRGALADPLLPRRLRGEEAGGWSELLPSLAAYWQGVRERVLPVHAGGRIKQWLMLLRRNYPEAEVLYQRLRPVREAEEVDRQLTAAGILPRLPLAA